MFSIKICGVTRDDDAAHAVRAGADAIGLNFYPPSPRSVTPAQAARLIESAQSVDPNPRSFPRPFMAVGVFVNESLDVMKSAADVAGLDAIQLHGDESPETVAELAPLPVVRAFRMKPDDQDQILQFVRDCDQHHPLTAVLIDAAVPGQFGGTGEKADWHQVAKLVEQLDGMGDSAPRLVLAGGLTPSNVVDAIETARPHAIDTASGVELAPGVKDAARVSQFISASQAAFGDNQ